VLAKLAAEVQKALRDPQVRERIVKLGLEPVGSTPQEYRQLVVSNIERFAELVKLVGIEPE
jgi:tripartite-type tricarboxylate transporter receptor subunit TctC